MLKISLAAAAAIATALPAAAVVLPFQVSYESESPGVQTTTTTFSAVGVETFEGASFGNRTTFSTDFGGSSSFSGVYRNVDVIGADQYGGAGGVGKYAVTFSQTGYTLDLTTTLPRGANYFGYWLSALDRGNQVSFFSGDRLLFTFSPQDVIDAVNATGNRQTYYGNPTAPFRGANSSEPYIFLNFYSNLRPFTKVLFAENPSSGGYESDNHTVGRFIKKSGTFVDLNNSGASAGEVPEPATGAMLISGFGLIGLVARRRRTAIVPA